IFLRQKQKKLIMLPSEILIWQPEFTDKTLSRKPGAVHTPFLECALFVFCLVSGFMRLCMPLFFLAGMPSGV
ncbi:hypothetical protein, partial [Escherichia coli]|uniref:hypothetical protein n=1 Tax=Escherichia coli TaxID=562 RepID=UPI001B7D8BB7